MAKSATGQRWVWWRRRAGRGVGHEAADFGTTFGLEMSLLESGLGETGGRRRAARPAWWRRLFGQRRPAA